VPFHAYSRLFAPCPSPAINIHCIRGKYLKPLFTATRENAHDMYGNMELHTSWYPAALILKDKYERDIEDSEKLFTPALHYDRNE
jgi:hypothetical protein